MIKTRKSTEADGATGVRVSYVDKAQEWSCMYRMEIPSEERDAVLADRCECADRRIGRASRSGECS